MCVWVIYLFISSVPAACVGGEAARLPLFVRFSLFNRPRFPCSTDHGQNWSPCKVVFFRLATNTLNVRNNNNNNNQMTGGGKVVIRAEKE